MYKQDEAIEREEGFLGIQARRVGVDLHTLSEIARLQPASVRLDAARSLIVTPQFVIVMVGSEISTVHRNPMNKFALLPITPPYTT